MSGKKNQAPRPQQGGNKTFGSQKGTGTKPAPKPPAGKPSMRSGNPQSNKKK